MAFSIPQPDVPLIVTPILFTAIALMAVLGKLYTRSLVVHSAGVDDYFMTASSNHSLSYSLSSLPFICATLGSQIDFSIPKIVLLILIMKAS